MKTILMILTAIAMLATLGTLFAGMLGMTRGNGGAGRSNVLMRWRVVLQGVTLLLFMMLMAVSRG